VDIPHLPVIAIEEFTSGDQACAHESVLRGHREQLIGEVGSSHAARLPEPYPRDSGYLWLFV
jgi:hypothetical protein